jgi:hypothetical protein
MGSFFGAIVSWLLSRLFGKPAPPSQEVVQAARAATAETQLSTISDTAKVQTAIAQAEASAPKDVQGVQASLREGTF